MEFYDVINSRRTIRDFINVPIDDEVIERIVEAGMKAPTNDHMRDWHFIAVTDKNIVLELISKIPKEFSSDEINYILEDWNINEACQQSMYKNAIPKQYRMFLEASCVIIPLFRQKTDLFNPKTLSDFNALASIWCSIENIFLAATAEGYACALRIPLGCEGAWSRHVLGYPEDYIMPCFIALGKPKEGIPIVKQKECPLSERLHKDKW